MKKYMNDEILKRRQIAKIAYSLDKSDIKRGILRTLNIESQHRINRIQELITNIYKINGVGGALHIVLDDFNIEDDSILWCIHHSIKDIKNEDEKKLHQECASLLLKTSYSRRKKIICYN